MPLIVGHVPQQSTQNSAVDSHDLIALHQRRMLLPVHESGASSEGLFEPDYPLHDQSLEDVDNARSVFLSTYAVYFNLTGLRLKRYILCLGRTSALAIQESGRL